MHKCNHYEHDTFAQDKFKQAAVSVGQLSHEQLGVAESLLAFGRVSHEKSGTVSTHVLSIQQHKFSFSLHEERENLQCRDHRKIKHVRNQ